MLVSCETTFTSLQDPQPHAKHDTNHTYIIGYDLPLVYQLQSCIIQKSMP